MKLTRITVLAGLLAAVAGAGCERKSSTGAQNSTGDILVGLYGSLTGNVTDSAGASVPGAKVEAVNVSTGAAKETTTNESGVYQLNDLQAGNYRVTISLTSFKTVIKEDIKVEANMVRRFDAQLEVGDVRETVVSLGKQLSRRWYVGYERSLNATTGSWQLIYRIAQRFTLRAQTGAESSVDLIWTWRWQ